MTVVPVSSGLSSGVNSVLVGVARNDGALSDRGCSVQERNDQGSSCGVGALQLTHRRTVSLWHEDRASAEG